MKISKLLVLSALTFMGLSANAANLVERTEPLEPDFGPGGLTVDNFAATAADFVIGDCYVLYNVGSQAFFGEGNAWGTQASISTETPLMVRFTVPAGMTLEDNALLFNDYANSKTAWKLVFFDSATSMFVDLGSQANYYWQVVAAGDKTYRLQASPKNPTYTPENNPGFVGLDVTENPDNTALSPFLDEADGHYIDWQFFAVPEWTTYYNEKDAYDVAMKLKAQIEVCEAAGLDVSAAVAVYNNLNATAAELNAAIEALKEALAGTIIGGTADNPTDATALITNPNFDDASYDGWLGTAPNMVGSGSHGPANVAEKWNDTFDTYQELSGLPDGVYALGAKTSFRGGWTDFMDGIEPASRLYVTVAGEESYVPFNNIWSCLNTEPLGGDTDFGTTAAENNQGSYYSPNDPSAFRVYEEKGFYDTTLFFEMSGGKLRIGVKNPSKCTHDGCDNWSCFDTFTLKYYGTDVAAYQKWVELSVPTVAIAEDAIYTQSYYDAYQEALTGGKATNKAEAVAAIAAVKAVAAELQQNISLWSQLQKKAEEAMSMTVSSDYDGLLATDDLADWLMDDYEEGILVERSLTNEELEATIDLINEMMEKVRKEYADKIEPGSDMTGMLTNPDFEFGLSSGAAEGWTVVRGSGGNLTPGPLGTDLDDLMIAAIGKTNHCFEGWHAYNWDIYQEIKSAPAGVYQISVQGYVRCEVGGYTQGDEVDPATIPIKLYMNNATSNFPSVYSEEVAEEHYVDGILPDIETWSWNGTVPNTPNSMGAASLCFEWGMYQVNTFGLVKDGEPMRIGVKNTSAENWWCIWDNFKITYQGFLPEYVQPALEAAMAQIDLTKPMAKSLFEKASQLQADAQAAIESYSGTKMFNVLSSVSDLVAEIDASVAIFTKLQTAVDNLMAEANESTSSVKAEALALVDEIQAGIDGRTLENADAEAYMEKIAAMHTKLFMPDYSNASDENPVDFTAVLQTPSFEKDGTNSIDGWVATGHKFGNDDQLFCLALESWESIFHIYQDVVGLPDGTYTLKVNGWQRTASPTYLYAESGGVGYSKELIKQAEGLPGGMEAPNSLSGAVEQFSEDVFMNTLIVKVVDGKLRFGVRKDQTTGNDWIVLDNFQLWYHGANSALTPDGDAVFVESVATSEPVKVEYYTLDGRKAAIVQKGILIQRTTYADGKVVVKKIRN